MSSDRAPAGLRPRLAGEGGFTVIEGVVAAMLLVIGVLGTLQLFDTGTRNTYRAEESQVVNDRLQAELEAIKQIDYRKLALTSLPSGSTDANDPRARVIGTQYELARGGGLPAQLVYNGGAIPGGGTVSGGEIDPNPTPFEAGDVSGEIHRFVAWTSDPACAQCGEGQIKRVIVAATLNEAPVSFERAYQEVHTDIVDPAARPEVSGAPGDDDDDEDDGTSAQFWLTDTTCNNAARAPITAEHLAHNTRGICSQGLKTGTTRGAPDLMYTDAPSVADAQATFDYATDSEPKLNAGADIGILMPSSSATNCLLQPLINTLDIRRLLDGVLDVLQISSPGALDGVLDLRTSESNKHHRVHTWVSPPVQGSGGVLVGRGTLDLYTQTINGAVHPGSICVWMSVRQSVKIPTCALNLLGVCISTGSTTIEVDLPYVNVGALANGECRSGTGLNLTNFTYSRNPWPTSWQKISVPMCFAAINAAGAAVPAVLPPNSRVALSIMVNKSGTDPGQGLEFMYDAVGYESKLLLESEEVIQF